MPDARKDPMGDQAAEDALIFLSEMASAAGVARAQMAFMEDWRKVELCRLKREAPEKTDSAREAWARAHADYRVALDAKWEAIRKFEELSWRRTHAEATLDAWRTKNANQRGAGRMQ